MNDPRPDDEGCRYCGGQFHEYDRAVCHRCGQAFHLALRTDIPVVDCGQVWINEELQALEFGCNVCLAGAHDRPADATSIAEAP